MRCDFQVRLFLNPPEEEPPPEPQAVLGPGMQAKHGEAWRSGNSLSYTGKSDQLYIQLSQTSSNIIKHLSDLSVTGFLNQRLICEDTLNFW
jgi:hypothetical protein